MGWPCGRLAVGERCLCADRGCPACHGLHGNGFRATPGVSVKLARLSLPATYTLQRVDMPDVTGTPMCDDCATDALESGLFRVMP
jgi:hypothetical protein